MKNKNLLIVLGFILLLLGFWWFQVRPANIRSECKKRTSLKISESHKEEKMSTSSWQEIYNLLYGACLNEKGLK